MSKFLSKAVLVLVIGGLIMSLAGFHDAKLLLKGTTVNINEASIEDCSKDALIEGKTAFAYGPFASLEQQSKTYGITTSTNTTNYYIVSNFDCEAYNEMLESEDFNDFYFIVSAAENSVLDKRLSGLANDWYNYLTSTDETASAPLYDVDIKGCLVKRRTEAEFTQYFNEAVDDLANIDIPKDRYTELSIRGGEISKSIYGIFFGGIAVMLLGIILFIASLVKGRSSSRNNW